MLARTLPPGTPAQDLHVDVRRNSDDWPLVGFIVMVDDFLAENGATRFVPGSHLWSSEPDKLSVGADAYEGERLACGPAGSIIIYNGSVWHGYSANWTTRCRRSIQGAFIPRDGRAAMDQSSRMRPKTFERIGGLAKYLLMVEPVA
jgi:ectoine hydroxylase-related dioxygenase (phytanoyl-CoA dioxygenase family)